MKVRFVAEEEGVVKPKASHFNDAGYDVFMHKDIEIYPGKNVIPLGFRAIIPPGHAAFLTTRSSWMGEGLLSNPVPVDADYSGIWHLSFYNVTQKVFKIRKGERLAQIVMFPVDSIEWVNPLEYSEGTRKDGGLGSTGK